MSLIPLSLVWHLLIHSSIRKLSYIRFVFFMVIIRKWTCCVQENDIIFFTLTCWISLRLSKESRFVSLLLKFDFRDSWPLKISIYLISTIKAIDERNAYAALVFHSNRLKTKQRREWVSSYYCAFARTVEHAHAILFFSDKSTNTRHWSSHLRFVWCFD